MPMESGRCWVGLDVGQARSSVCVIDDSGTVLRECDCDTSAAEIEAVLAIVPKGSIEKVAMEAGCGTHLSRRLRLRGYEVVLLETRKLKRLLEIRRNKTDANDARGIADVARLTRRTPPQVHLKSLDCQHLRTRLRLRQRLIQQRLAAEGFVRSLLQLHGGKLQPVGRGARFRENVKTELERLWLQDGADLFDDVEPLVEIAESLRSHLSNVDDWLLKTVRSNPVCSRFLAIPGVGPVCALSFFSAVEQPFRFQRSSDVAAYFGLTPRLYESGDVRRMFGITRMGNKLTRAHLVIAARNLLATRKQTSALQDWGLALVNRVGRGRARVAVARKLAILMLSMWKRDTEFDPKRGRVAAPVE